jgi:iron complex transport system ATP-binding protein
MIALNKLTTGYISKEISKDLDLTIEKGTLVGVLGSNGIGKSTLLKTLAGFENPLNGTITIDGKDIHEMSPIDRAKNLSIVLTQRSLSGDLLGKEVIQLGRQPHTNWIGSQKAKDRELVSETIEQMNIGALADRKLKTMSDGEIQKILLARALAQNTAIVLLDEPSAHLDLYNKALLFQQIKKIVSLKQKTILFTSHDLNSAIQICDKILLLLADRWEFGTPDELIQGGVFQTVFPKETVGFDPLQKQFKICI